MTWYDLYMYLCWQTLEEASEAKHGPFYVTSLLEVKHDDLNVGILW